MQMLKGLNIYIIPNDTKFSTNRFVLMGLALSNYLDHIKKSQLDKH